MGNLSWSFTFVFIVQGSSNQVLSQKQMALPNIPLSFVPSVPKEMLQLKHSFSIMVAGPSKRGKTLFVKRLLQNLQEMITPSPEIVYWCYGEYQEAYIELEPFVQLHEGLPDLTIFKKNKEKAQLLILDDLMADCGKNDKLTTLFTKGSHHWNLSIVHLVQNLFFDGLRNARINSQYLVLMKNPSDQSQVATLARQMFPKRHQFLIEAYQDATSQPHGYLFIDLHQNTVDHLRFRTCIFPGETGIVYVPK